MAPEGKQLFIDTKTAPKRKCVSKAQRGNEKIPDIAKQEVYLKRKLYRRFNICLENPIQFEIFELKLVFGSRYT